MENKLPRPAKKGLLPVCEIGIANLKSKWQPTLASGYLQAFHSIEPAGEYHVFQLMS